MINKQPNHSYVIPQRRELSLCINDLLMDLDTPAITVKKILNLVYAESVKLDRQDVIEVLELHNLIKDKDI